MAARLLNKLPNELWNRMVAIVVECSLRDALSLCQTCSRFFSSYPGQRVRYLCALAANGLCVPSTLAEPPNLSHEADLLFDRWPFVSPRRLLSVQEDPLDSTCMHKPQFLGRPQLFGQTLIDLDESREKILVCQISPSGLAEKMTVLQVIKNPHPQWGPIRDLSIDIDAGNLAVIYEWETASGSGSGAGAEMQVEEGNHGIISLEVLSLLSGRPVSSPYHHVLEKDETAAFAAFSSLEVSSSSPPSTFSSPPSVGRTFLSAELKGSKVLLAAQDQVLVFSWSLNKWNRLFNRKIGGHSDSARLDVLSASFFPSNQNPHFTQSREDLDPHCLVVMSSPDSSLHGRDWGSELEFYKLPKRRQDVKIQVPDVSISLPIKAKVKPAAGRGLNYVRTGDSKRERFGANDDMGEGKDREFGDSLVVICVEGFIWLATLSSFLEVLYPVSALAVFGEDPTLRLGIDWVRGNMTRCSLSAADTAPITPVSVSGWRLAVPWSRSPFARQRGPRTQSGGPDAAFIRFLDANPRNRNKKRIKEVVGDENSEEKVYVSTMWWSENDRYIIYFDHFLDSYLQAGYGASCDVLLTLEGSRLVLSVPSDTPSGTSSSSTIIATI